MSTDPHDRPRLGHRRLVTSSSQAHRMGETPPACGPAVPRDVPTSVDHCFCSQPVPTLFDRSSLLATDQPPNPGVFRHPDRERCALPAWAACLSRVPSAVGSLRRLRPQCLCPPCRGARSSLVDARRHRHAGHQDLVVPCRLPEIQLDPSAASGSPSYRRQRSANRGARRPPSSTPRSWHSAFQYVGRYWAAPEPVAVAPPLCTC